MSFAALALISIAAALGPVLALRRSWRLPVILGELLAGMLLGASGAGLLDPRDPTFAFLADVGFALVMFVAGSHVPVRELGSHGTLRIGFLRATVVGALAVVVGHVVAESFGTGHAGLYAVLMASSSAAFVLPVISDLELRGTPVLQLLPQVAIADAACIVLLPLVVDPARASSTVLGLLAVGGCAAVLYLVLRRLEDSGLRRRAQRVSQERRFAIELRVSLAILFTLAALAVHTHVSVMVAGFSFGLVVAAIGEPRRLARQLFAVTDGFLGPLFFVWLGASIGLGELLRRPFMMLLGLALGVGATAVHLAMRVLGQPISFAGLAAAQLGVPVAAATIGEQQHLLSAGEPAALLLAAVVTIVVALACAQRAVPAVLT
ncbi:cation:proton antiporter [Catellatospora chokoriensis]|uniref:Cation/H+ exchanger transmembrane domain-containing protein n=1 Tax=Catellatospora chokoriensis TaxID=310353 RepID=A0A8J3K0H3_9ACTN|nr:cation:proton antiporter [Catellatospora chokoriensis]GIF94461.1 hypothetical protein Cch02nite_79050 [Catellatospora chokoriensis]